MPAYRIEDNEVIITFTDVPDENTRSYMRSRMFRWDFDRFFWHAPHEPGTERLADEICGGNTDNDGMIADEVKHYRHICWYPSAGSDFKAAEFLSRDWYGSQNVPIQDDDSFPTLFILTDATPNPPSPFISSATSEIDMLKGRDFRHIRNLYRDIYSDVPADFRVRYIKRLPNLTHAGTQEGFITTDIDPGYFGRVFSIDTEARNGRKVRFMYVFAENTSFARDFLLKYNIPVEHMIVIRYGHAFGGSALIGDWVPRLSDALGCRYLTANEPYLLGRSDLENQDLRDFFPAGTLREPDYTEYFRIDGTQWSGYGPVVFYRRNR